MSLRFLLAYVLLVQQCCTIPQHTGAPAMPLQLSSGWTILQNNIQTACAGASTCAFAPCAGGVGQECIAPTISGSVMAIAINGPTNVTISSGSGGGGTWVTAPSNSCHVFNSTLGQNQDIIYNVTGTGGTQAPSVNLSGSSAAFTMRFFEALPPSGYTASFDTCGTSFSTSCTTSCALASLSLSATDLVWHFTAAFQPWNTIGGNSCSPPFLTSIVSDCIGINVPSGTSAPTLAGVATTGTGSVDSGIAWKSSAGAFTYTGSSNFSLVQYTLPTNTAAGSAAGVNCTPACPALTAFASTGSGNLLVLIEGDSGTNHRQISSISGGGTWVVPSGAGTCNANNTLSCAYTLSSTGSTTSITPTLTGSTGGATASFALWEWHRTTGTWTLDTQGAKSQTAVSLPVSPTVTCTGTNDVVIGAISASGGVSGMSYGQVGNFPGAALNLLTASPFSPSNSALFNTTNCGPFTFPFENGGSFSSNAFTVAFQ